MLDLLKLNTVLYYMVEVIQGYFMVTVLFFGVLFFNNIIKMEKIIFTHYENS